MMGSITSSLMKALRRIAMLLKIISVIPAMIRIRNTIKKVDLSYSMPEQRDWWILEPLPDVPTWKVTGQYIRGQTEQECEVGIIS